MATSAPLFPSPRGGVLRALRDDSLGLIDAMAATGQPLLRYKIGPLRQLGVFDAELAREVLSARPEQYPRPALLNTLFKQVTGLSVFTAAGEAWRWRRRALQPPFARAPMERLGPAIEHFMTEEVARLEEGRLDDIQAWFASIALSVAASVLFTADLTPADRSLLDDSFRVLANWTGDQVRTVVPRPVWVPTAANRRVKEATARLRAWLQVVVDQRRAGPAPAEPDVLDTLLAMTDPETGQPLPDELLLGEMITLLFAGYETTAAAATWAVVYLADRPDLQAALARGEEGLIDRVIDETLRLRPPGWGAPRMAAKADTLGGYRVRRWTTVIVSVYGIHRNPAYWPDPDTFDPDRFLPEQVKTRPGGAFLPFIVGPRHCLGMRLALLELRSIIPGLCRRFELTLAGPVRPDPTFALRVAGHLPVELKPRQLAATS